MQGSDKKHVCLMGPPRVTADVHQGGRRVGEDTQRISQDAKAMQLLALLLLSRRFLTHEGAKVGGEVRRDWLLEKMSPDLSAAESQGKRDNLIYLLGKLDEKLEISAFHGKREPDVFSVTLKHLSVDVLEIAEAAKRLHVPENQELVIRLADRPLLEDQPYPWLQESEFQKVRAELDACFLTALSRQADSRLVQMEKADGAGQSADAAAARSHALPLLDKAAERLRGYGERLCRPEYAALHPFEAQFRALRRRAAYPLPEETAPPPPRILRPITSFVGREQETQRIMSLLATERLVTLTGMGGCGKTRLALEVAAAIEKIGKYGVWPVELASLGDPALLPQTVATTLGLEVNANFIGAVIAYFQVQEKPTLLLLDNCEHLVQDSADLVETLLQSCPALKVLATSRRPLDIDGEHLCPLQPLPFPAPDSLFADTPDPVAVLLGYDAARLFVDRLRQFRPFTLGPENIGPVAAICTLLDGIPLALELAAARFKAQSLDEIAERLKDRFALLTGGRRKSPARHKTLRAVIDWSYDLLTEPERALLCRLSVFAGGWTLNAAEAVGASEDLPPTDVLGLLESLVDHSLVVADPTDSPGRYWMLKTVQRYAVDRLRERGEWEATRHEHRDFFVALAEEAEAPVRGAEQPKQQERMDRLESQIDDVRAALAWCFDPTGGSQKDGREAGLRLAGALRLFWDRRGYSAEGRRWLEAAIEQGGEAASPAVQAKALGAVGPLVANLGEPEAAIVLLEKGLALQRQLGDNGGAAITLNSLGLIALDQGRHPAAKALFQESLRLRRETADLLDDLGQAAGLLNNLGQAAAAQGKIDEARELYQESLSLERLTGNKDGIALALNNLAILSFRQGDYPTARALLEESLPLSRELGHKRAVAYMLNNLGVAAHPHGDDEAATAYLEESIRLMREMGEKGGIADALNNLADIALHQRRYVAAREWFEESLALRRQIGNNQNIAYSLNNLGELADKQGCYAEATAFFVESLTLMRQLEDTYGIAFSLEGMASVAALTGRASAAARLWAAAESLREATGSPLPSNTQEEYQSKVAAVRTVLGDAAFESAWEEGRAMKWEAAVAFALEEGIA